MDNTAQQLRLAADIAETGHPWEYYAPYSAGQPDPHWETASTLDTPARHVCQRREIRLAFARPPYEAELHNPDNLTAEQVGAGYRLPLKSEGTEGKKFDKLKEDGWVKNIDVYCTPVGHPDLAGKTYRLPLSVPWPEQPAPFTLPTPPPGMQWHRADGWTAEMLPPGTRPLAKGELLQEKVDSFTADGREGFDAVWGIAGSLPMCPDTQFYRTTRPLLFQHEGHEWTWHRAGDPMPCDGERMVLGMTFHSGAQRTPTAGKNYLWEVNDRNPLIGWRYADTEKPDDSPSWIEWRGGECPLDDEEVEEWEYEMRNGAVEGVDESGCPSRRRWEHIGVETDIIAYRVLKARTPTPKQPLGPEDVPPGSVFRFKGSDDATAWQTPLELQHYGVCFHNGSGSVMWKKWGYPMLNYEINRSIPLTGKWNPEAWEACER